MPFDTDEYFKQHFSCIYGYYWLNTITLETGYVEQDVFADQLKAWTAQSGGRYIYSHDTFDKVVMNRMTGK